MSLEENFGKVLKDLRAKSKLSQEELADMSRLDRTYISLLERGLRQPTLGTLFSIAKSLQIAPSEIVSKVQLLLEKKEKS